VAASPEAAGAAAVVVAADAAVVAVAAARAEKPLLPYDSPLSSHLRG
jgi:hypothetical protein